MHTQMHSDDGMTRDDCDRLRAELEAAGVPIVRVEEPRPGVFWLVYFSTILRTNYIVTHAARFRGIVAAGLDPSLPATTFRPRPHP
jgi:hypothetical protein